MIRKCLLLLIFLFTSINSFSQLSKIHYLPPIAGTTIQDQAIYISTPSVGYINVIIKPIGGTIAIGLGKFSLDDCKKNPSLLKDYFNENNEYFKEYIVQELIKGFTEYGEIKSYWINGNFSYAVNTPGAKGPYELEYKVKEIIDKKVIAKCQEIGKKVIDCLPRISFNRKKVLPALVRIDFSCCKDNKRHTPINYFVNEIESEIAGSYTNFENVKYPYMEVMADTFVKKTKELYPKL